MNDDEYKIKDDTNEIDEDFKKGIDKAINDLFRNEKKKYQVEHLKKECFSIIGMANLLLAMVDNVEDPKAEMKVLENVYEELQSILERCE